MITKMMRTKGIFGVYQIELNNKIYVGSTTCSFKGRWNEHLKAFRKGKNSRYLQNSYNKYGEDALKFSVLEVVKNKEDCLSREQYYIDTLKPEYNICQIAGSNLGMKWSNASRQKLSITNKGRKMSDRFCKKMSIIQIGKKHTEETKRKIGITSKGRKFTEEAKQKMSEAHKGRKLSVETRYKLSKIKKGIKFTEEHKKKMSEANKGHKVTEETRKKMSMAQKLRYAKGQVI